MPTDYGYPSQRRNYRSNYQYQQPNVQQYQSFFNPIPIEFLQDQLSQRQGKYDTAYAGALATKETMAAQQAALQDLGSKNQIIGDVMGNIDKTIEEKYGGDWGRGAKEIARMVSSARQNPFWETTKHLSEQQKIQQEYQLDNPDAHIYQDVLGQSSIDSETGQVRNRSQLTFRGGKKGDWLGSVEKQFADVRANVVDAALKKAQGEIKGMLSKERTEEIKDTTLKTLATQGVNAFLENNRDFYKSKKEIEGLSDEQIRIEAESFIYDNIQDKAYKSKTSQVMQAPKAVTTGTDPDSAGIIRSQAAQYVEMVGTDLKASQVGRKGIVDEISDLENRDDPDSIARVKELKQQQIVMDSNVDFIFDNMQSSPNRIDIGSYYTKYATKLPKGETAITREQFDNLVMENFRNGTRMDEGTNALDTSNLKLDALRVNQAVSDIKKNFKKYAEKGSAVINANIITGTEGATKDDTFAGQYNNLLTKDWRKTTSGYTIPYSNRQIGDVFENEKKYKERDPNKDQMVMTDGSINGKFVYQVNSFDKAGNELGSEYVVPDNQADAYAHLYESGKEIMERGLQQQNQYYIDLGRSIILNANYGPSVQKADIHNNRTGTFPNIKFGSELIHFENVGTFENPLFNFYVKRDGKKDWFENNGTRYTAVDEDGIKEQLNTFITSTQTNN